MPEQHGDSRRRAFIGIFRPCHVFSHKRKCGWKTLLKDTLD
jgi:hypothetical protein